MSLVSIRAYARHRGVSQAAVQKAIRSDRIELVSGRIDVAKADLDWARNTGLGRMQSRLFTDQSRTAPLSYATSESTDRLQRALEAAALLDGRLAELTRIEIEERRGRLVRRNEIESALMMMGHRTAHMLANESDPANIEAILVSQIRATLRVATVAE